MAVIGEQLPQPEVGWRRYDDSVGLIKYEGTWQSNMPNASSWMGTRHISSNLPDKVVRMVFRGTKFRLLVNSASNRSTNSTISIDGQDYTFSSRFTTTLTIAPMRLAFEKLDLPYGYHTVIITDTTTDYIDIDAVDIDEDGELVRYDYLDNIHYDENIKKYGIAWFGFDEESGNALDKLGGEYLGTVTGATRTDGWNGEGYSVKASGINQRVSFNGKIVPNEDYTISFKIKALPNTSAGSYLLGNIQNGTTGTTYGFTFNAVGDVVYYVEATTNGGTVPLNIPIDGLLDNQWHDVMLTRDVDKLVSIYVDNVLIRRVKSSNNLNATNSLTILNTDRFATGAGRWLNGQIDELIIYSKALVDDDIIRKSVAIKTNDNKILTLPNKQGRVKELPSENELDIINQGYIWLEVDNNIDSKGIELTHATTEYEIVGKNNTILGNGKLFTLPISNFKTVKVENNE